MSDKDVLSYCKVKGGEIYSELIVLKLRTLAHN